MRVVIDATPLLLRSAGVKTHVYNWIRHLRRLGGDADISTFPLLGTVEECPHERSVLSGPQTVARLAFLQAVNYSRLPVLDWLGLRADVFHASHQLWNPPRDAKVTTTIYDMTCWVIPDMQSPQNVSGARRFAEHVLRRADGFIANSESARQDAIRILGLPEEGVEVIYPGISEAFFDVPPASVRRATEKHGLSRPYVLFVGTIEPRKNVDTLLDAYEQLPPSLRDGFTLVFAGPLGWAHASTVRRLRSDVPGVRYLGYVPEPDLPGLTAGATVFLYPSLYEGFGLPVAQAMAAGVPVITSSTSSLPEVTGEAGVLIDPRSPADIRSALERLLLDPERRAGLAAKGAERARRFTWDSYARQSLAFFRTTAGK